MPAELGAGAGLVSTTINLDALSEDTRVYLHMGKVMGSHKHKLYIFNWSNITFIWTPAQKQKRNEKTQFLLTPHYTKPCLQIVVEMAQDFTHLRIALGNFAISSSLICNPR